MNLKISYIENTIEISQESINVLEIENKKMFYRLIKDFYKIKNGENIEEICFYDQNNNDISVNKNIHIIMNYFELEMDSKKNLSESIKVIIENVDEIDILELSKLNKKITEKFKKIINKSELPLIIEDEFKVENFLKIMKTTIRKDDSLLNELLTLIELNKVIKNDQILIFINLKDYLSNQELNELYKYVIYNNMRIILIDSRSHGSCLKYEKKIIIDENLNEFMLK